jgi:predicted Zn-ribbon and HTH transcriptional regulator
MNENECAYFHEGNVDWKMILVCESCGYKTESEDVPSRCPQCKKKIVLIGG